LLVAGDKARRWDAWYREAIPLADERFIEYLPSWKLRKRRNDERQLLCDVGVQNDPAHRLRQIRAPGRVSVGKELLELQCLKGARSSSAHRPGVSAARINSVTRESQSANSARNSSTLAVALQDSSTCSPAGAKATRLTARWLRIG
jgi:hypothetical protein